MPGLAWTTISGSHQKESGEGLSVQTMLKYIVEITNYGLDPSLGAGSAEAAPLESTFPAVELKDVPKSNDRSLRDVYVKDGLLAFAKAVRDHKYLIVINTTWRYAHQPLLATRVRTKDFLNVALVIVVALSNAYSLECWGGATFDASMRCLKECPWDKIARLREAEPDTSSTFQTLLRGANVVMGYNSSYPDNVTYKFCEEAQKGQEVDVLRVFDSLNYIENNNLSIDAVGAGASGATGAMVPYTRDVTSDTPREQYDNKYNVEYHAKFARQLKFLGIYMLAMKSMAGLLKPTASTMLTTKLGIDAVGAASAAAGAMVPYADITPDTSREQYNKFNLEYHVHFARQLKCLGIYMLAMKSMAGLLKPTASTMLNMNLGVDAVGAAASVATGAMVPYTGDITSDTSREQYNRYNLEYHVNFARQLKPLGIYMLAMKSMVGLLKPTASTMLVWFSGMRLPAFKVFKDDVKLSAAETTEGKLCIEGQPVGADMPPYETDDEATTELDDQPCVATVKDSSVAGDETSQASSDPSVLGSVGAPVPEVVVDVEATTELDDKPCVARVNGSSVDEDVTSQATDDPSVLGSVGAPVPEVVVDVKVPPGRSTRRSLARNVAGVGNRFRHRFCRFFGFSESSVFFPRCKCSQCTHQKREDDANGITPAMRAMCPRVCEHNNRFV